MLVAWSVRSPVGDFQAEGRAGPGIEQLQRAAMAGSQLGGNRKTKAGAAFATTALEGLEQARARGAGRRGRYR